MPYKKIWNAWYQEESLAIKRLFADGRVFGIEHFGSTSVPGMYAKPVIDILVGLNRFHISDPEMRALNGLGYAFIEQSSYCQRYYFKKRGERDFNISLVRFAGDVWDECLAVRAYLRSHSDKREEYSSLLSE